MALIEWLPPQGAYAACVQDLAPPGAGKEPAGPHRFYGRGLIWHLLADLWDLNASVAAGKKGKTPTYPRPAAKKKPVSLFDMAPKRR